MLELVWQPPFNTGYKPRVLCAFADLGGAASPPTCHFYALWVRLKLRYTIQSQLGPYPTSPPYPTPYPPMPRFEPVINQFIVPDDPYTIAAAPPKPKRSSSHNIVNQRCTHKRKGSISALERLSVFAEATQRVKRRLRNVIAGAVGASASQPRRKVCIAALNLLWFYPSARSNTISIRIVMR